MSSYQLVGRNQPLWQLICYDEAALIAIHNAPVGGFQIEL